MHLCSPDVGFGIFIVHGDVFLDGGGQLRDAAKHATAQALGGDVTEEPFDHVETGGRGGSEMNMESRMLVQPLLNLRMLVGGIVVANQVKRFDLRRSPDQLSEQRCAGPSTIDCVK